MAKESNNIDDVDLSSITTVQYFFSISFKLRKPGIRVAISFFIPEASIIVDFRIDFDLTFLLHASVFGKNCRFF